jgi:hypothetical protein
MSTTSQHLGLKIPDGSDPFLRTDFVNNLNLTDSFPGDWLCTSTTRPNWGASQAGMKITETDTRRTMLWNGTTWREMLTGPAMWWGSLRPGVMIGRGTTVSYVVGTFTVNRPGTLFVMSTTELGLPGNGFSQGNVVAMVDGSLANWDGAAFGEFFCQNNGTAASVAGQNQYSDTFASIGVRTVNAGTHSVGVRVNILTQPSINNLVRVTSIRSMAMFVNGTDR